MPPRKQPRHLFWMQVREGLDQKKRTSRGPFLSSCSLKVKYYCYVLGIENRGGDWLTERASKLWNLSQKRWRLYDTYSYCDWGQEEWWWWREPTRIKKGLFCTVRQDLAQCFSGTAGTKVLLKIKTKEKQVSLFACKFKSLAHMTIGKWGSTCEEFTRTEKSLQRWGQVCWVPLMEQRGHLRSAKPTEPGQFLRRQGPILTLVSW